MEERCSLAEKREGEYLVGEKTWVCSKGHRWKASYNSAKYNWCQLCTNLKRLEIEIKFLCKEKQGKCSTEIAEPANKGQYFTWKCCKEHEWNATYTSAKRWWCKECKNLKRKKEQEKKDERM